MAKNTFHIPVTVAGVKFRNPFYVSSGPTTMTIEQLEAIRDNGWGGASLKLTVYPLPYINREPRYGYYPKNNYLTFTAEKRLLLDELLHLIEQGKKRTPEIVLFSNITYAGDKGPEGWATMARKCEAAGVDIVELNMCCPNMSFNVEVSGKDTGGPKTGASMGQQLSIAEEIVRAVKKAITVPLFLKLTPEGGRIAQVAEAAYKAGADAVGGTANRLGIPPIDLDNPKKSQYHLQKEIGMACMNGPWLRPLGLRDVYEIRKRNGSRVKINGVGGVSTWENAVEMAMCGADLVGICTRTITHGFDFMPEFIQGVKTYMKDKGYKKFSDMRDILVPAITSAPDLTLYKGHAVIKDVRPTAPCTYACPNSVPAQGYVRSVAEGKFEQAYQLIMSRSPLQFVCGKVCDHPCEDACTRGEKDEPIMIREIKRFVLDMAEKKGWRPGILDRMAKKNRKKVAVIGSGPSGIACAYDLARAGYSVTIFEASEKPGGMLRYGIPAFRLNDRELNKELETLKKLKVRIRCKTVFGKDITIPKLKKDGFKAFFMGVGAQKGWSLDIDGEDADGCIAAVDFLRSAAQGKVPKIPRRVAVIGGGFTAIDAARTARRLGAREVFVLYRRTRDEMPATDEEVNEAEEEGVKIMYLVSPQQILTSDGQVSAIEMSNYTLSYKKDRSGRRRPVEVQGTDFTLKTHMVISAIGQSVEQLHVRTRQDATVEVDPDTLETSVRGVFAGGDCVTGPGDVISAIAHGKRAAVSMDRFLSGKKAFLDYPPDEIEADKEAVLMRTADRPRQQRTALPNMSAAKRIKDFTDHRRILSEKQAVNEASRCLTCGCGVGCQICHDICKMFAYRIEESGRMCLDEDKCVGCGMCAHRCPNNVIEIKAT